MHMRRRHGWLLALLWPMAALGWGPHGHRVIARIAADRLDATARAAVADLLQGEPDPTLAGVSTWADDLRGTDPDLFRRTSRWHYVNIRSGDCAYVPARDCPGDDCVVAAIDAQLRVLGDRSRPRAERAQALKFVVHLVGDVHQPFHAGHHDDRGGNDWQLNYRGQGTNLHAVWDSLILDAPTPLPDPLDDPHATAASHRIDARIDAGAAQRWAEESCRAIDTGALYPQGHVIDDAYLEAHRSLAEQRLREAGERLAAELDAVLGAGAALPPPSRP